MVVNISSKSWRNLKKFLAATGKRNWVISGAVSILFPIVECVLVNYYTSSQSVDAKTAILVALCLVALVHLCLALTMIHERALVPQSVLARVVELEQSNKHQRSEFARREKTSRLLRDAFQRLNLQTCSIQANNYWCVGGYQAQLMPVLEPLLNDIDVALGVRSPRYSLEAYFLEGAVPTVNPHQRSYNSLFQHVFISPHRGNCSGVCLEKNCSPVTMALQSQIPFQQHIAQNEHLFFLNGAPKPCVYFRRFAACNIKALCSNTTIGVLVVTSIQDEPFAEDVLDTMEFFGTLIAQYTTTYQQCYWAREHERLAASVKAQIPATIDDSAAKVV